MKLPLAAALLLLTAPPASAHRLDEYLQGTLISLGNNHVDAQITLTPGVAVFPFILAGIDTDGDGALSPIERHAYAERILNDLTLAIDGRRLKPRLRSFEFPAIEDMMEGRGEIRIEFGADLPRGAQTRKLTFENRHQERIAAYQVNCLVPRDPAIRVLAQKRNYTQSLYELDFTQAGAPATGALPLGALALLLAARLALLIRRRP